MPNIGKKPSANSIGVLMRMEPPHSDRNMQVRMMTDGIGNDHRRGLEERGDFLAHAGQIHVMRPDDERQETDEQHRIHQRFVAPERLARVVGDDFADDAHRRQNQNINFRMAEEPEQMLPQQRAAAAAAVGQVGRPPPGRSAGRSSCAPRCPSIAERRRLPAAETPAAK